MNEVDLQLKMESHSLQTKGNLESRPTGKLLVAFLIRVRTQGALREADLKADLKVTPQSAGFYLSGVVHGF